MMLLFRGMVDNRDNNTPYILQHNYGKNLYDIVSTGYAGLYLFSDKVINVLINNKITGWKTYPCILLDKNNKEVKGYSIFSVMGKCGSIDLSKSATLEKIIVEGGKPTKMLKGLYFDINTWDGSDVFSPEGTMFTFITRKVRNILLKENIPNILMSDIIDYEQISTDDEFKNISDEEVLRLFGFNN